MVKFYIDAYADMFGKELKVTDLNLVPSKIKHGSRISYFKNYTKASDFAKIAEEIRAGKYSVVPLEYQEWYDFFEEELKAGNDVVYFSVSTKLLLDNGEGLKRAFRDLNKKYPKNMAILMDTKTVSRGTSEIAALSKVVYEREGDLEAALDFADTLIGKFVSIFVVDSADSIKASQVFKGAMSSFTGASLNLKPIISIDTDGNFKILDKAKTFKSAVSKLYSNVKENGQNIADYTFSIVSFNADEEAHALYKKFREVVNENEIRLVPLSLNNAILVGGKCIALTFHSKY